VGAVSERSNEYNDRYECDGFGCDEIFRGFGSDTVQRGFDAMACHIKTYKFYMLRRYAHSMDEGVKN